MERLNLVTGATGFSGSHVVARLLGAGQRVVATDTAGALESRRDRLAWAGVDLGHPKLSTVPADLLDPREVASLVERPVTHVFHTASLYDYAASLERLVRVNVDGTRHLLDALRDHTLSRFVHWSTCGVFGKPRTAADGDPNLPFDERSSSPRNTPPDAEGPVGTHLVNDYSRSKWRQEKLVWAAHRDRGLPVTVVRPAPIYGPGSDYGHGGIIRAIARGWLPAIPADARNAITASVHVRDVAGFACFAADADPTLGEDYDLVDDSVISYHEFLHHIALLTGRRMVDVPLVPLSALRAVGIPAAHAWTWAERRLGVPRVRVFEIQSTTYIGSSYWLANDKSKAAGYTYDVPDVQAGLRETVAWMRDAGWL